MKKLFCLVMLALGFQALMAQNIQIRTVSNEEYEKMQRARAEKFGNSGSSSSSNNTYYFYGERQKTTLVTHSGNTQYQIKYIVVKGPEGLSERDIAGRFGNKFKAFGMQSQVSEFINCGKNPCNTDIEKVRGRYSNMTLYPIGQFDY